MQVPPKIILVDPHRITPHPMLATIPMLDEQSPEFHAILASIKARGVDEPVIIDETGRLVDGRNRARCAAIANAELPAIQRRSEEAPEIILSALVHRRHLPKGALAYLSTPLFQPAVDASRQRQLANVHHWESRRESTQSTLGKTVEQLAAEMGFGRDLYFQAVKVRQLFEKTEQRTWHDGAREVKATFRAWFEPKILSGEIGLGGVIQAIAGKDATEGKTPEKRGLPTLIRKGFTDLKNRFSRWEAIEPAARRELTAEIANEAAQWPEDVRQRVLAALEKAAAHRSSKPSY